MLRLFKKILPPTSGGGGGQYRRGRADERAALRRLIDDSAFGIASLEVLGDGEVDSVRTRAVASYARHLLYEIDRLDSESE